VHRIRILQLLAKPVIVASALAVAALTGCGKAGDGDATKCVLCGSYSDIRGAISTQDGSQSLILSGWAVAAIERSTNIARVAEINDAGLFTLPHVNTNETQTLALFSSDYILTAVLSMPGSAPNTIRQFFNLKAAELPKLISKGPIMTFQTMNGLEATKDVASDQNGNGIPDGVVSIGSSAALRLGLSGLSIAGTQPDSAQDLDRDGLVNEKDPDIDGDGIVNILDPDDNGNGTLDVLDADANGDYQQDNLAGQEDTDQYFSEGVEWVSAQFTLRPLVDGTGNETSLTFRTKLRDDVTPIAVQIRGAPSLLDASYFKALDASGAEQHTIFNRVLGDDGLSDDGAAGDRLYGKKVYLPEAKAPRANEAIFFQLVFGTPDKPWFMEFPYIFPDLKPAALSARYDPNTKTVGLIGNPFGEYRSFSWTVYVYNEAGKTIWISGGNDGSVLECPLPDNIFDGDAKYTYDVSAQVQDKIPGTPAYVIYSKRYNVE
jgi:hypothetical protein